MKICHVVPDLIWGGLEEYVLGLVSHLRRHGDDVEVLVRSSGVVKARFEALGVPVRRFTIWNLVRTDAEIVHLHSFRGLSKFAVARLFRRQCPKLVLTRHIVRPGRTDWFHAFLYARIDRLIFVSDLVKRAFFSSRPSMDESKTVVIRNSIAPREPASAALPDVRGSFPPGTIVLMSHGRLAEEKGVDVLLRAMRHLVDLPVGLVVVGTGERSFVQSLEADVRAFGLVDRVRFAGFQRDVMPFIRQADIGIVPSTIPEAFSLSVLEYMSVGVCPVTTNNGGQVELVVDGETGFLVPPGDEAALAAAIRKAVDPAVRRRLGANAKERFVRSFSYPAFFERVLGVYKDLVP